MVFCSISFLGYFLPCLLAAYFILPVRWRSGRNLVLLFFSIVFYAWGSVRYLSLLLASVLINYIGGLFAGDPFRPSTRKLAVLIATAANLGLLGWYKYAGFFAGILNDIGLAIPIPEIILPIGISFFTFQGLSYVLDVGRGTVAVQKNPLNVALYVVLFPQLVAGPIVRYSTVETEILTRRETLEDFSAGATRFMLGLGKKMLLANTVAELADAVFASNPTYISVALAWLGAVAYSFQIYFDFSAYSDMAIGLGWMFGFHFLENFNYPYISTSVTEFWRRWHISLSSFFRDYIYIPLGGNRCSTAKHIRNMAAVWLLTGLWHGAAWTFVAWGIWLGLLLICEKYLWRDLLQKSPAVLRYTYTMMAVILSWVLFRSPTIRDAAVYIGAMFGSGNRPLWCNRTVFYLRQYGVYLTMCCIGAVPLKQMLTGFFHRHSHSLLCRGIALWGPKLLAFAVLLLSYMKLATGSFNPFIYFQF